LQKAVFLDRDGTIIEDNGYLSHPSQVVFFDDTFEALRRLQKDFMLFIITNQQGIGNGVLTPQEVEGVNLYIVDLLKKSGIHITDVYVCPHTKDDRCICRKPKPYFLHKAEREHGINLKHSFVVGDHPSDIELALNVGARGIFVLTGHGRKHVWEIDDNAVVVPAIGEASVRITGKQ